MHSVKQAFRYNPGQEPFDVRASAMVVWDMYSHLVSFYHPINWRFYQAKQVLITVLRSSP